MKAYPILLLCSLLALCSGCFIVAEDRRVSNNCTGKHAARIQTNMTEIARIANAEGLPEPVIELVLDTYESATRVAGWSQLTEADIGRASAPPTIMTTEEIEAQGVYKNDIELKEKIQAAVPIVGANGGDGIGSLLMTLIGGGGVAAVLKGLHGSRGQLKAALGKLSLSEAANADAMDVIAQAPTEIQALAANKAALAAKYGERKEAERARRIAALEGGNHDAAGNAG